MKERLLLTLMMLFLAVPCYSAQWTNGQQVVKNIIWKPGYHGFYVDMSAYHDPEDCGSNGAGSNRLYLIDSSLEAQDEVTTNRLYSMLLTALSTGSNVHVWVNGCHESNPIIPKFSGLQINK